MYPIIIVNMRYDKDPEIIKCDRSSKLGNPFPMRFNYDRDKVCTMYEVYFEEQVIKGNNEGMLEELRYIWKQAQLRPVKIGCHCAPKRCHCLTIKNFLESQEE